MGKEPKDMVAIGTAMVAALAGQRAKADRRLDPEDQAATRVYPIPEAHHPAEPETRVQPRPQLLWGSKM